MKITHEDQISILVLMEVILQDKISVRQTLKTSGFNPCFNGSHSSRKRVSRLLTMTRSFNPCFNGSHSSSRKKHSSQAQNSRSFNPCFNGSHSSRVGQRYLCFVNSIVSILVLMEVILQGGARSVLPVPCDVSILVLMEVILQVSGVR